MHFFDLFVDNADAATPHNGTRHGAAVAQGLTTPLAEEVTPSYHHEYTDNDVRNITH
jgi:hypothetical protein